MLSPDSYNAKTHLAICCPITSHAKGYPFEVALPAGLSVRGVVLSDQLKSLDWQAHLAELIASLPELTVLEILRKASLLVAPGG